MKFPEVLSWVRPSSPCGRRWLGRTSPTGMAQQVLVPIRRGCRGQRLGSQRTNGKGARDAPLASGLCRGHGSSHTLWPYLVADTS